MDEMRKELSIEAWYLLGRGYPHTDRLFLSSDRYVPSLQLVYDKVFQTVAMSRDN